MATEDDANKTGRIARPDAAIGNSITAGALMGVGVAAFIDETVFHQSLHWHHFYDKSTPTLNSATNNAAPRCANPRAFTSRGLCMANDRIRYGRMKRRRAASGGIVDWVTDAVAKPKW